MDLVGQTVIGTLVIRHPKSIPERPRDVAEKPPPAVRQKVFLGTFR